MRTCVCAGAPHPAPRERKRSKNRVRPDRNIHPKFGAVFFVPVSFAVLACVLAGSVTRSRLLALTQAAIRGVATRKMLAMEKQQRAAAEAAEREAAATRVAVNTPVGVAHRFRVPDVDEGLLPV